LLNQIPKDKLWDWRIGVLVFLTVSLISLVFKYLLEIFKKLWLLLKPQITILQSQPDMPISDVINYMVNDSSAKLKRPKPPEIEQFGKAKGLLISYPGIGHVDAV
jgi:hypothetical protein